MASVAVERYRMERRWILVPAVLSILIHLILCSLFPLASNQAKSLESHLAQRFRPVRIRPMHTMSAKSVKQSGRGKGRMSMATPAIDAELEKLAQKIVPAPESGPMDMAAKLQEQTSVVPSKTMPEEYRVIASKGAPQVSSSNVSKSAYGTSRIDRDVVGRVQYAGHAKGPAEGPGGSGVAVIKSSLFEDPSRPSMAPDRKTTAPLDPKAVARRKDTSVDVGFTIDLVPAQLSSPVSGDVVASPSTLADPTGSGSDNPLMTLDPVAMEGIQKVSEVLTQGVDVETDFSVYREPGTPKSFFRLVIRVKDGAKLPVIAKNVLFVADVSLSITLEELIEVRKAVETYLRTLSPEDKFNVVRFSEDARKAFFTFVSPTPENIERGVQFIEKPAGEIKTDVYRVLQSVILNIFSRARPCQVFLISDGAATQGVRDTHRIVREISPITRSNTSIFTFNAGEGGNNYLLDLVAYRSRGKSLAAPDLAQAASQLGSLCSTYDQPVLMNLSVTYAGLRVDEVYPQIIPNLYRGQGIVIHGQCEPGRECAVQIYGETAERKWKRFLYPIKVPDGSGGDASIAREWARGKIHYLVARLAREGEQQALIDEVLALGERYNLPVPFEK